MKFETFRLIKGNLSFEKSFIKKTLNFLINRQEEITIFNHSYISDDIQHVVFHIPDELISGTKKGGIESSQPFSQYINTFVLEDFLFIEHIKTNYSKMIISYLENNNKILLKNEYFQNSFFNNISQHYQGSIKSLDVTSKEGEIIDALTLDENFADSNILLNYVIQNGYTINSLSIQALTTLSQDFITIEENGMIVTNTKSETNLITLLKDVKTYARTSE